MTGTVRLAIEGDVAHVVLSNPGKLNAMSRHMWRELRGIFMRIQGDPGLRCVVIGGEGGHFCSGGDIAEYASFRFAESSLRDFHENDVWGGLQAMIDCDVPMVARVEGNCMGAGLEMACCCDLRLASDDARCGAPIAKLGFPMAPREAALVARVAGEATVREMLLAAAVLGAPEMQRRGFFHEVLPPTRLADAVTRRVDRIKALAPQAARLNKQTLRVVGASVPPSAMTELLDYAYDYAASAEHREGVMAFVEKREPVFTG
ncbi:enoyl-CoA hydratase/isomerase family protein [Polaromonas sp. YR568]|uniref:enoyl-CoA hydratase/isomerase family protein n=1 Tax=Polaromonas sp. YR568 TaxID=1855301 RepID=UPI003137D51B